MRNKFVVVLLLVSTLIISCDPDPVITLDQKLLSAIDARSKTGDADYYILVKENDFANIPKQEASNPLTKEKVELGKMLFFETGLAQNPVDPVSLETYSCGSCHVPSKGFLPGRKQGIADGGVGFGLSGEDRSINPNYLETEIDAQGIRPLTIMNVTYVPNTLWSGTFGAFDVNVNTEEYWTGAAELNLEGMMGLETQNIDGQHVHRFALNEKVLDEYGYRALFDEAFPEIPVAERYSEKTLSFALSAYCRTVLTNQAPFQDYLKGNVNAITQKEKEGALLFFTKANCANCHYGPSFSSMNFHKLGTEDLFQQGAFNTGIDDIRNLGRGTFTGESQDDYAFKVPQLYNLKDYEFYFHGSSKKSLDEVIEYKVKARPENPKVSQSQLSPFFNPLDLTTEEREQLKAFLTHALYDPNMERYVPQTTLSGNCFPNNDPQSRIDLNCN